MKADKTYIKDHIDYVLTETNFSQLGEKKVGKVRDIYRQGNRLFLISTDRHSSFDRIIAHVPFKGEILTQTSLFWFENTKDIIGNHVIESPDPHVVIAKVAKTLPVEVVVRGYLTGVTSTSIWTNYQNGKRDFGDFVLPDGMVKNQKLEHPVITPTTKSDLHDENVTLKEVVERGLVEEETWNTVTTAALNLFKRGQDIAKEKGLILVDTKYEFGIDENGEVILIDEIHTPDSSRWWMLNTYEERIKNGLEPEYFDKEFLRLWFKENSDPYNDAVLPKAPDELVAELAMRYISIFEKLTGKEMDVDAETPILDKIESNLKSYFIS